MFALKELSGIAVSSPLEAPPQPSWAKPVEMVTGAVEAANPLDQLQLAEPWSTTVSIFLIFLETFPYMKIICGCHLQST